jgi:hypothetical protein
LISAKVASDIASSRTISRAPRRIAFRQRLELRGLALGLGHQGGDIVVGDAELLADLHVVGELVFGFLHPADLEDREFAQARVELALEADVAADAVEGARHVRASSPAACAGWCCA